MRSPPPSHATLNADAHTTEPCDAHVENLRASLLRSLPPYVAQDIIDTPLGHSLADTQTERDRRVRLLIRRYVNQIQSGCLNRNCATPTCLSYRKRNSKGPVRSYTDLSARSLACHLIEEHSKAGKDPNDGLCQNQPAVPWYRDPASAPRRLNYARELIRPEQHHANGSIVSPKSSQPKHTSRSLALKNDLQRRPYQHSDSLPDTPHKVEELQRDALDSHTVPNLESRARKEASEVDVPPEPVLPDHRRYPYPSTNTGRDHASFTQAIWDTPALRTLNSTQKAIASANSAQTFSLGSGDPRNPLSTCPLYLNTAFCGLTLRRLSWSSLRWLQATSRRCKEVSGTPFETFVRNSLFYSCSSAERLHESAETWRSSPEIDATEMLDRVTSAPDRLEPVSDEMKICGHYKPRRKGDNKNRRAFACRPKLDISATLYAFETMAALGPGLSGLFSMLRQTVQGCYTPSSRRRSTCQRDMRSTRSGGPRDRLSNPIPEFNNPPRFEKQNAAETLVLVLLAMVHPLAANHATVRGLDIIKLGHIAHARSDNVSYPSLRFHSGLTPLERDLPPLLRVSIDIADVLENQQLRSLAGNVMNCISHHLAHDAMEGAQRSQHSKRKGQDVVDMVLDRICESLPLVELHKDVYARIFVGLGVLELARNVVSKEWDREPIIKRTSPVGGALEFLKRLYHRRYIFHLCDDCFRSTIIADAFADDESLTQWLAFEPSGQYIHVLSFAFLLDTATLVRYFRSINIAAMKRTYESATAFNSDAKQFLQYTIMPVYGSKEVLAGMRSLMARYFVLTIRRSNILEDAINQLWRRERREVLRPLRVRLGKDEGEDGIDHGGVQQEFFRLAFAEAFNPERGMFTADQRTHMTWLQPGSYEPLYQFEALGILMSLAVYNAVTLPVTMPLAFYRKLLGLKVKKLEHIIDGWPELARGLRSLLEFEGDVAETIGRTYEFSYDIAGTTVNVDMQKAAREDEIPHVRVSKRGKDKSKSTSFELPVQLDITPPSQSPPSDPQRNLSRTSSLKGISTPLSLESDNAEEAAYVTNDNREQYVKDYITWLTDKSIRLQWDSFAKGFFTCIDQTALTLFTPEQLQHVVEGHRNINIDELKDTATYEEYDQNSSYIQDFWAVVRSFTPDQHRQLLEFVTASDRVPVNGMKSVNFVVQKHGEEDNRLPSSGTCYQRLLLPQYSSKKILEEKLSKALENSLGFGTV